MKTDKFKPCIGNMVARDCEAFLLLKFRQGVRLLLLLLLLGLDQCANEESYPYTCSSYCWGWPSLLHWIN